MELKKLEKRDIDSIIELEKHNAPDAPLYARYDRAALNFIFENSANCSAFGIFDKDKLVGWGAYRTQWSEYNSQEKGTFEISSIVVDSAYRRQGIGKQLLDHIFSILRKHPEYKKIYLTVSPKNIGALLLYLKNGFEIYEYKKDVYGPGSDRLYLFKE